MRIGIIGAGRIGQTVGELLVDAGDDVMFASRHPDELLDFVHRLGDRARVGTPAEAAQHGAALLLSVPLGAVPELGLQLQPFLRGKVVLDTSNPYPKRDGVAAADAVANNRGTGQWTARHFPTAHVVKAFNTVPVDSLRTNANRLEPRVAIPLAGDDQGALDIASQLVRRAGFVPVIVGALASARQFDVGTRPSGKVCTPDTLRSVLEVT